MKKSIIVLLIAVLAVASAFADPEVTIVKASVDAKYSFDLDEKTAVYSVTPVAEIKWSIAGLQEKFTKTLTKAGEGYPYVNVVFEGKNLLAKDTKSGDGKAGYGDSYTSKVTLKTFEIIGEDWKLNLIGEFAYAPHAFSFSTIEYATGKTAPVFFNWNVLGTKKAVTFAKDGHSVSAIAGQFKEKITQFAVVFNSKGYSYEEFAGNFSAGLSYKKTSGTDAVVLPYVGFEIDHYGEKGSSSLKADLAAYKNTDNKMKYRGAIELNAKQDIASVKVFYAKADDKFGLAYYGDGGKTTNTDVELFDISKYGYLEAQGIIDASAKKIATVFTILGTDLLHKDGSFDVTAETTLLKGYNLTVAVEEITKPAAKVTAHGHVTVSPIAAKHGITWELDVDEITAKVADIVTTGSVTYANEETTVKATASVTGKEFKDGLYSLEITQAEEKYTASANVAVNGNFDKDGKLQPVAKDAKGMRTVDLVLGIESDKLVDGATVYAKYDADNLYKASKNKSFGEVTTGIKVTF